MVELENKADVAVTEVGEFLSIEIVNGMAIDCDLAGIGFIEGAEDMEQCGFTGSGSPYEGDDFAFINLQVNTFQHLKRAE